MKKSLTILVLAVYCMLQYGCEEDEIAPTDIIKFEISGEENLVADNYTTLKLRVIIPADADVTHRSIKFKTDIGNFSNEANEITIEANPQGNADAYLHSSKPGRATIVATVSTYSANKNVNLTAVDISKLIRFDNFDNTPLVADNMTERLVKVVIDKNTPSDKRNVTFVTDLGSFTNDATTINILANADGIAQTFIKSEKPGKAKIKATVNSIESEISLQLVAPDPDQIIRFAEGLTTNSMADGISTLEIRALINSNTAAAQRKVTFTTDQGSFGNGTKSEDVMPDAAGTARALLKSNLAGKAFVTITHRNVVRNKIFDFEKAYPDKISLTTPFTLKAGFANLMVLQTKLSRTIGVPSSNFEISYTALDSNSQVIGLFKNAVNSDDRGNATVEYSTGLAGYRGKVILTAFVKDLPAIMTTAVIYITD